MRYTLLVMPCFWVRMSVPKRGVNRTSVMVVWTPVSSDRGILQITIRPGKRRGEEVEKAIQEVMSAVKQLQFLVD